MTEFSIRDFLDIEAVVDNEEEEEEDEDEPELANFFDDDIEESETGWGRHRSVTPSDLQDETEDFLARAAARRANRAPRPEDVDDVPQHYLLPAVGDPELWAVRVKPGCESGLVMQIATRCLTGNSSGRPTIASAFARPGIPGWVFLEGRPCDVTAAVRGLVTVYSGRRLVPPQELATLLSRRSPLSRRIHEGEWVRCLHGLYRGDIGLVCDRDSSADAEVIAAFVPRIPEKAAGSAKRKRPGRPEPRKWTSDQVKAVWGNKVQNISTDQEEYEFRHETYKSGLVIKHLPPASVAIAEVPADIGPFVFATYISNLSFYSSIRSRNARDTIKVGHRVKVVVGETRGAVGRITDVRDGTATVTLQATDDIPPLIISLRALLIKYSPGDHVKHRFADSMGILSTVDEVLRTVTFVERDTNDEHLAHMDNIEPYSPPSNFYRFTPGVWVHFRGPRDSERPKRRGYITAVEEAHALVLDERTFTEFKIDTRDLEVSASQAPSLPAGDLVHPLLGRRVVITQGQRKGYDGVVRDVGNTSVTVELHALFAGAVSPIQPFAWHHLRLMSKEEEIAKSNPGHRPRTPTPPPGPECDPLRALTPEPEGSHWVFSSSVQDLIERKTIPFYIRNTHESSDQLLRSYVGCTGRTVPVDRRTKTPREGEIIISVFKRTRRTQISVHPKFLFPWEPVVGDSVVAIKGPLLGALGVVKATGQGRCTVSFSVDNDSLDYRFEESELAAIED